MEIWRDIPGYVGRYQASSCGRIRSLDYIVILNGRCGRPYRRRKKGQILRPKFCKSNGYYMVTFPGKKTMTVHRAVAMAFLDNKENKREVNHKNSIKTDNYLSNLEWSTSSENRIHAFENGLQEKTIFEARRRKGSLSAAAKLSEKDIPKIREAYSVLRSQRAVAKLFNMSRSAIRSILLRQTWSHI